MAHPATERISFAAGVSAVPDLQAAKAFEREANPNLCGGGIKTDDKGEMLPPPEPPSGKRFAQFNADAGRRRARSRNFELTL